MKTRTYTSGMTSRNPRNQRLSLLLTIGLICVLPAALAFAQQLCYPPVATPSGPPNWSAPPLIDGSVANGDPRCFNNLPNVGCTGPDLGWATAFGYIFNNPDGPNANPDVTVEGNTDGNYLYLSVQANNTTTQTSTSPTDANNAVVVAFDPDNTGTKMQWFVIYVTNGSEVGSKQMTQQVTYYFNQSSLSSPNYTIGTNLETNPLWLYGAGGTATPTSWQTNCFPGNSTASAKPCIQSDLEGPRWSMEMAIPIVGPTGDPSTGLIIPSTGLFRMYIDVLRVVNGQWSQAPWPATNPMPGCSSNPVQTCFLDNSIPATPGGQPSAWGNGTIAASPSPACNGVSIGSQSPDIQITNSTFPGGSDWIDGMNPNTFTANVHNTGPQANNVGVTFYIANFGLPGIEWQQVAQAPTPNFGTATIPPGGTTLVSNSWTPPASQLANYITHPHQCILATLSSNPTISNNTTFFVNSSAVQNADFFDLSKVERPVEISSKGYPVNPQHNTQQEFDIFVKTKQDVLKSCPGTKNPTAPQQPSVNNQATTQNPDCTQLVETAEACRHTGTYLSNNKKQQIELCQPVGSFTFVAKHQGTVGNLTYTLTGPGLGKPDSNGVYHLRMANDSVVDLKNVIEAQDGTVGGNGCSHLFGFAVSPLLFGGILAVGLFVYRPRKGTSKV